MTVDQAREEAKRHLGTIADGADPAAAEADDRRRSREETITALFPYYLSEMTGRWKPRTLALITDLGNRFIIPALGSVPVRALTPQRVIELHRTLGEKRGHVTANHVGRALRAFGNWADRRGMVEGKNPMSRIGWYREISRERFLSGAELARLGEALRVAEDNRSTLRYSHLADTVVSAAAETVGDTIAATLGRTPTVPNVLLTGRR